MKNKIAVFIMVIAIGVLPGCGKRGHTTPTSADGSGMICDFENIKAWDISPETGFDLSLSANNVTEGKHSLKVVYPAEDLASINTRKLPHAWGEYNALTFDVFNPQNERVEFNVRLDDSSKKRANISYPLEPGMNHVKIERARIAREIDPADISRVVMFINNVTNRITLYFDNMSLSGKGQPAKEDAAPPSHIDEKIIAGDKPVSIARPDVAKTGSMRVPIARLNESKKEDLFISSGIPFSPGKLYSDKEIAFFTDDGVEAPIATRVLAHWPQDGSVRSVLVQFRMDIPNKFKYLTMRWGQPRTAPEVNTAETASDMPDGIILLPPRWLCESLVVGEEVPMMFDRATGQPITKYDQNIITLFPAMRDVKWTDDTATDNYYDTIHVFYQLYARTGDPEFFKAARREAVHYRDKEMIWQGPDRGRNTLHKETRYIFVEAMSDDYLLTGDAKSLEMAGYMAEYLKKNYNPSKAYFPRNASHFYTEREQAFPLIGLVTFYELTGDKECFEIAKKTMLNLYKTQNEWPERGGFIHNLYSHDPEEGARRGEQGGSPFMTGLLLEGVVKYHRITNSAIAKDSIFKAVNWLMKEGMAPESASVVYTTADSKKGEGTPDLNLLVVHAFGYAYRLSDYKNMDYLDAGRKLFEAGANNAWLGDRKHFNQNYRSSGHFLSYVVNHRPET